MMGGPYDVLVVVEVDVADVDVAADVEGVFVARSITGLQGSPIYDTIGMFADACGAHSAVNLYQREVSVMRQSL